MTNDDPLNIKYNQPTEHKKLRVFKTPDGLLNVYVPTEASYTVGTTDNGKDFAEFELMDRLDGAKFKIGDQVTKPKGYRFNSEVRAVYTSKKGEFRVVAENADGLMHIFNESQLELA